MKNLFITAVVCLTTTGAFAAENLEGLKGAAKPGSTIRRSGGAKVGSERISTAPTSATKVETLGGKTGTQAGGAITNQPTDPVSAAAKAVLSHKDDNQCTLGGLNDAQRAANQDSIDAGFAGGDICFSHFALNAVNDPKDAAVLHRALALRTRGAKYLKDSGITGVASPEQLRQAAAKAAEVLVEDGIVGTVQEGMARLKQTCENDCDLFSKAVCSSI